jgi:hypothetical protein
MRQRNSATAWRRRAWGLVLLAALAPTSALADGAPDELEHNRQLLAKLRSDPEHYARLKQELRAFLELPPEDQTRLRRLDYDLRQETSASHAKLFRVLERYTRWLEALPAADRERIESAANPRERLDRIKQIRQEQWIAHLPKAYRDKIDAAKGAERTALIQEYRQQDKVRREEWQLALRHWDDMVSGRQPSRLREFQPAVQTFVNEHLKPRLSADELDRLEKAEGKWPLYAQVLVELADKHAVAFPGAAGGPKLFSELPKEDRAALERLSPNDLKSLRNSEGKWPEFALRVVEAARRNNIDLPRPLGPSRADEFPPSVRNFIRDKLAPALEPDEKERLAHAEGHWPAYPRTLLNLARRHHLWVPGMSLPGPREYWNKFRAQSADRTPDLPDKMLFEFVKKELSPQERTQLQLQPFNESARERLKEEYFKRHPDELQRIRRNDRRRDLLAPGGQKPAEPIVE